MKKIIVSAVCYFSFLTIYAQNTLNVRAYDPQFSIDFENRNSDNYLRFNNINTNVWQIGTPTKSILSNPYSNKNIVLITDTTKFYPINNNSSFEFVLNTDDATNIKIYHGIDSDTLKDGGIIEFSTDNGITWTNIHKTNFLKVYEDETKSKIAALNNELGYSGKSEWISTNIWGFNLYYVRFRFTFASDEIENNRNGWTIYRIDLQCLGTGINEISKNNSIEMFPNPVSDILTISTNQFEKVTIKDLLGNEISCSFSDKIDVSELISGMYIAEIYANNRITFSKFSKL